MLGKASVSDKGMYFSRAPSSDRDADQSGGHREIMRVPSHHHAVLDKPRGSSSVVTDTEEIQWVAYWQPVLTPSYLPNQEISDR